MTKGPRGSRLGGLALAAVLTILTFQSGTADASPPAFHRVAGTMSQIAVGDDGSSWGVDSQGHVFHYAQESGAYAWRQNVGAPELASVAVAAGDDVWGLTRSGGVRHRDAAGGWLTVGGTLGQLAVGADGDVWGLEPDGSVSHLVSGRFVSAGAKLESIVVGDDGDVYGLSKNGQPRWWNPGTASFQNVGGAGGFSRLAVGADGALWALKSGVAEYFNVLRDEFVSTSLRLSDLALGTGESVYGLTAAGDVESWQAPARKWGSLSGPAHLRTLAVGGDGTVWAITTANAVYELTGQARLPYHKFAQVPGSVEQLSVGADGSTWAVHSNSADYFDPSTQAWTAVKGAAMTQVSVGAGDDAWGVHCPTGGSDCSVWRYSAQQEKWVSVPGELNLVEVAADGAVWGLNASGDVFTYRNGAFKSVPGQLGELSVGADGAVWGIDASLHPYRFSGTTFEQIPGSLVGLSVGASATVWGVDENDNVYAFDQASNSFTAEGSQPLAEIWATFDGAVWGVDQNGVIYQWNPGEKDFQERGSGVDYVLAGNDNAVWGVDATNGTVYEWR